MKRLPQLKPFFAGIGIMMLYQQRKLNLCQWDMFMRGEIEYRFKNGARYCEKKGR